MAAQEFIIYTVAVSTSGALSPGPLFFSAVFHGPRSGVRAGVLLATGHMAVEFPLVILLSIGLAGLADHPAVRAVTGIMGGIVLAVFGGLQAYRSAKGERGKEETSLPMSPRRLIALGAILSGLNPFFLIWWLTVGLKLVVDAVSFAGLAGVLMMYLAHIWMDYGTLGVVAQIAKRGIRPIGSLGYRVFAILLGVVFIYYGAVFVTSAF